MRKSLPVIVLVSTFFLLSSFEVKSQPGIKDSLYKIIALGKEDTATAKAYSKLSDLHFNGNMDSLFFYNNKTFELSRKIKYLFGEAYSYLVSGYYFNSVGNNSRSLTYYLDALKLFEQMDDKYRIAIILINISSLYDDLNDNPRAMEYARRAYAVGKQSNNKVTLMTSAWNIGFYFCQFSQPDSALPYFQENLQLANTMEGGTKDFDLGQAYGGMGLVNDLSGNTDIAIGYLRKGIGLCETSGNQFYLSLNYYFLANLYQRTGQRDSSIFYYEKTLKVANAIQYNRLKMDVYKAFTKLYEPIDQKKMVEYFKLEAILRDSLFDARNNWDIQNQTYAELERQRELKLKQDEAQQERKANIQYAAIVLVIVVFITLFLLLSRSVIVNEKIIKALAFLGLLIFFEFLNLLLHPFLEDITHHSPALILLALVCIAALLIPLHHKLEKFITTRMIEKNNRIRLQAAKKVIAKLEPAIKDQPENP